MKPKEYYYIQVIETTMEQIEKLFQSPIPELCLNDVEQTTVDDKIKLQTLLSKKFCNSSKYEKG